MGGERREKREERKEKNGKLGAKCKYPILVDKRKIYDKMIKGVNK
jgi:hypothetical protein